MSWHPFLLTLAAGISACGNPAEGSSTSPTAEDLSLGESLFVAHCARCHGIGGGGGEGPDLRRPNLDHATDDQDLFAVIRRGIPGTGMPGTGMITEPDTWQLVGYTRSLGQTDLAPLEGDPDRGGEIYHSKGLCFTCHIVAGKGSSLGRDLTDVGARRGPEYLRNALINPGASRETMPRDRRGYTEMLMVRVLTREGEEIEGMRINEDGFTIQLRDASNRFHSFRKLDLLELERQFGKSLMQSYRDVLSPAEIDDVVAYLASLRGAP